nr:flavodoxin domain-containing protein [Dendrosporobacter quercicolus]
MVAYSSRYGSTGDVAAAIGKTLQQHRFRVDVRRLSRVEGIAGYRGVVLGSPVHSGKWLPEATDFIQQHQDELAKRPVAYFLTSMTLALTQEVQAVAKIGGALTAVRQQFTRIEPVETALFAGALDYRKMSPLMQVMYRIFAADDRSGDYRDWKAIAAWAGQVAVRFS